MTSRMYFQVLRVDCHVICKGLASLEGELSWCLQVIGRFRKEFNEKGLERTLGIRLKGHKKNNEFLQAFIQTRPLRTLGIRLKGHTKPMNSCSTAGIH